MTRGIHFIAVDLGLDQNGKELHAPWDELVEWDGMDDMLDKHARFAEFCDERDRRP